MFTFLRQSQPRPLSDLLHSLTILRHMGGGPRTFPGGLNKWQWKRLHEKQAKEKEKRLLNQEKQLYQARIKTQIRAQVAGKSQPGNESECGYNHMSPRDQVKALADRFMTEKAEDLWNEDDGPIKEAPLREFGRRNQVFGIRGNSSEGIGLIGNHQKFDLGNANAHFKALPDRFVTEGVEEHWNGEVAPSGDSGRRNQACDMRGNGSGGSRLMGNRQNLNLGSGVGRLRYYSVRAGGRGTGRGSAPPRFKFRKSKNSSSDDEDSDYSSEENDLRTKSKFPKDGGKSRYPKFKFSEEELESESDSEGGRLTKKVMGRGVLESYDKKKTRFVPKVDDEDDDEERGLSEQVAKIREELMKRKLAQQDTEPHQGTEQRQGESLLSNKRFDECNISPLTVKALTSAGYIQMTKVQEATISACLDGMDALVKAKTGTGKSAAFLLPAIEAVLKATTSSTRNQRAPPILVLILCPTRELASQIAAEANVMLKHHDGIGVQTLIGGTRFKLDQKRLESDPCQIIVATPGRLLDHIENKSGFSVRLMGLKMIILDEADRLLDLGFRKDIEKIVDCVPRQRQSLLLSATVPKEVRRVSQLVLKREHVFIDTVGVGGVETHDKVKQLYYVAPHELHFPVVYQLLKDHISNVADYKVIVFCTTSMVTSLLFSLLRDMKLNVREMHSRKPQLYRTRMSDEFRESKRLILVTSDVSARGMNYPDVTLVIQVGIPTDREQYIHRLGRTGREGKEGEGILLLAPWEEYFLDEIKDLPIQKSSSLQLDSDIKMKVKDALLNMDSSLKEAAYHAWLGYYNSVREIGRDKTTLVEHAKRFCESIGLQNPPSLFRKTAVKMGLRDIPGIRIRK